MSVSHQVTHSSCCLLPCHLFTMPSIHHHGPYHIFMSSSPMSSICHISQSPCLSFTMSSIHHAIQSPHHPFTLQLAHTYHVIQSGSWSMPSIYHVMRSPSQPVTMTFRPYLIISPPGPSGDHLGEGCQHPGADPPLHSLSVLPSPPACTLRPSPILLLLTIFLTAGVALTFLY